MARGTGGESTAVNVSLGTELCSPVEAGLQLPADPQQTGVSRDASRRSGEGMGFSEPRRPPGSEAVIFAQAEAQGGTPPAIITGHKGLREGGKEAEQTRRSDLWSAVTEEPQHPLRVCDLPAALQVGETGRAQPPPALPPGAPLLGVRPSLPVSLCRAKPRMSKQQLPLGV